MAVPACPFDLLDDDAMGSVLDSVRRDRLGNETIPGHVCEATSWRLLGKQFLAASIRHPSEFNGAITKSTTHDGTEGCIDTFSGGKRYTRIPTHEPQVVKISMHCKGQMQLHIVRHPPTGRMFAITSFANPEGQNAHMDSKKRRHLIPLFELARKLSGHTARFEERLNLFDKIAVFGKPHRVRATGIDPSSKQSITTNYYYNGEGGHWIAYTPMCITFQVEMALRNNLVFHVAGPTIRLEFGQSPVTGSIPPQLDDVQPGETLAVVRTAEDAKLKSLSALSIAFGFYEPARIAECGGWLVSLWRDNLAAPALLSLPTRHDPTQGLRHRGELAIAQAAKERREVTEATKRALTVHTQNVAPTAAEKAEDRRQGSIVQHDGPSAALVIRPRKCTRKTVQSIKSIVKDMNQTHTSGRLHAVTQPWDSREDEATTGLVDDQYANPLDPESDSDDSEDEEDAAYVPPSTSRGSPGAASSDALLSDRLQRAIRMRQMVMIDSDDGSDDDEGGGGGGGAAALRRAIAEDL